MAQEPVLPRAPDPNRVDFTTSDGVALVASWRPAPGKPDAPAILLVHEFSRDRREWDLFSPELSKKGFASLALDLRGHGESTRRVDGGPPVRLVPRLQQDSKSFPRDVEAACRWLRQRCPRVGVLGLSVGGNLAVLATASQWADSAVAVSPNSGSLSALAGSLPQAPSATLILASESDPARAASARALTATGKDPKRMLVFSGSAHSLELLQLPEAREAALGWFVQTLGPVVAAPSEPFEAGGASTVSASPRPALEASPAPQRPPR